MQMEQARHGKKLKKFYWAIEDREGQFIPFACDGMPMVFATRPWVSKSLGEKAVKVKIIRYQGKDE